MKNHTTGHTTNYLDTFIEVAADTKVVCGTKPPVREGKMTIAALQFDLIFEHPYKYSSDDILFQVFVIRNKIKKSEQKNARAAFFSKGQPCLRASPLTKTYGFGLHADHEGKIALYGMETKAYEKFVADKKLKKVKAMRTTKKLH